jgi:hypothetical protein
VDEITAPPNGSDGSSTGTEPVAMTICSARISCSPVSVSTTTVLPSRNRARPWMDFTPAFFNNPATPVVSRPTIRSFQAIVFFMSMAGSASEMPSGSLPPAKCVTFRYSSAAWISALDGMQPMVRQVPPGFACSTMTVSTPSCPARMAQT